MHLPHQHNLNEVQSHISLPNIARPGFMDQMFNHTTENFEVCDDLIPGQNSLARQAPHQNQNQSHSQSHPQQLEHQDVPTSPKPQAIDQEERNPDLINPEFERKDSAVVRDQPFLI
jgi:hypothetical protein